MDGWMHLKRNTPILPYSKTPSDGTGYVVKYLFREVISWRRFEASAFPVHGWKERKKLVARRSTRWMSCCRTSFGSKYCAVPSPMGRSRGSISPKRKDYRE